MDQYNVIANQPIVIDNGSGVVKAGFAGDEIPKVGCKYCSSINQLINITKNKIIDDENHTKFPVRVERSLSRMQ